MDDFKTLIISIASGIAVAFFTNLISWCFNRYFDKRKHRAAIIYSLISFIDFYSRECNVDDTNRKDAINKLDEIRFAFNLNMSKKDIIEFRKIDIAFCEQLRLCQTFDGNNCIIEEEKQYFTERYIKLIYLFSCIRCLLSKTWLTKKTEKCFKLKN